MRFSLEHVFDAPIGVVEQASNSDEFLALVSDLPNVGERKVTELTTNDDGTMHRVTRYTLGSQLPAPVVAVLGQTASWDEIADFDPSTHAWTFTIKPNVLAGRFECNGSYRFEPSGERTTRRVDVDVKVSVPLVGGRVEKEIRKGLVDTMEAEAAALSDFIAR